MKKNINILVVLAIVLGIATFLPLNAQAYTIIPGGPGIGGYYGYESYNFSGKFTTVDATVFFAVFAPQDTNNPWQGQGLYAYTYLVQNHSLPTSTAPISQFTVGPDPLVLGGIANIGNSNWVNDIWDNNPGTDLAPNGLFSPFYQTDDGGVVVPGGWPFQYKSASSVIWNFLTPMDIKPGGHSLTLAYTSPFSPGFITGSLQDGGSSGVGFVPGPAVPEPGSMLLLGMGILGIFGLKRRKVI